MSEKPDSVSTFGGETSLVSKKEDARRGIIALELLCWSQEFTMVKSSIKVLRLMEDSVSHQLTKIKNS